MRIITVLYCIVFYSKSGTNPFTPEQLHHYIEQSIIIITLEGVFYREHTHTFWFSFNPNPLAIFTRKYPESTKIHQFCHTQNAGVLNPSESASVDIGHILNPPKSTTNFLVDFGRFRIPCSHENLYSMLLHRIHQNLTYSTCNYNPSTNMTKQLKTIEILNPSKSATCSMWRYPESAKIFQYRGMDFDGFRVVRVNIVNKNIYAAMQLMIAYYLLFSPSTYNNTTK